MMISDEQMIPQTGQRHHDANGNNGMRLIHSSRRQQHYAVKRHHDVPPLVIKRLKRGDARQVAAFHREAQLHQLIRDNEDFAVLRDLVPVCLDYDKTHELLVFESIDGYQTLDEVLTASSDCRRDIAARLGAVLGKMHGHAAQTTLHCSANECVLPRQQPEILTLLRQPFVRNENTSRGMVEYVQQLTVRPVIAQLLETVQQEWQVDSLIHQDLTWRNVLIGKQLPSIKLINWQASDLGDSAWDVGSVMQNYLTQPIMNGSLPPRYAQRHTSWHMPLQLSYAALTAFMASYLVERKLSAEQQALFVQRALLCCAAKIILTGYEYHHSLTQLSSQATALLDLAISIFAEPETIALSLMQNIVPGSELRLA